MRVCAGCANRNEATANVDPESEKELMEAVAELTHDKTVIMIAHRLKTVRHADQIFVVDHGEIVQQGTHDDWWLLTGSTAALWWNASRLPGGRSDFTLHIIQQSPYQLN